MGLSLYFKLFLPFSSFVAPRTAPVSRLTWCSQGKPAELDRAQEGLEHFVCLNLYNVLFSPQMSDDSDKDKVRTRV